MQIVRDVLMSSDVDHSQCTQADITTKNQRGPRNSGGCTLSIPTLQDPRLGRLEISRSFQSHEEPFWIVNRSLFGSHRWSIASTRVYRAWVKQIKRYFTLKIEVNRRWTLTMHLANSKRAITTESSFATQWIFVKTSYYLHFSLMPSLSVLLYLNLHFLLSKHCHKMSQTNPLSSPHPPWWMHAMYEGRKGTLVLEMHAQKRSASKKHRRPLVTQKKHDTNMNQGHNSSIQTSKNGQIR